MNVSSINGPSGISTKHCRMYTVPPMVKLLIYPLSLESTIYRMITVQITIFPSQTPAERPTGGFTAGKTLKMTLKVHGHDKVKVPVLHQHQQAGVAVTNAFIYQFIGGGFESPLHYLVVGIYFYFLFLEFSLQ